MKTECVYYLPEFTQRIVLKYIELVYIRTLTCGCNNNNNC